MNQLWMSVFYLFYTNISGFALYFNVGLPFWGFCHVWFHEPAGNHIAVFGVASWMIPRKNVFPKIKNKNLGTETFMAFMLKRRKGGVLVFRPPK